MIMADIAIISKVNTATPEQIEQVRRNIKKHAPKAKIILANSIVTVNQADRVANKRVLVVEDAPTLTHGGMAHGAGLIAAQKYGAGEIVDPRPFVEGTLNNIYTSYPHIGPVLPAMGYSPAQIGDLENTINNVDCDLVLFATPINLDRLVSINHPAMRVFYNYGDHRLPDLESMILSSLDLIIS